MGDFDLLGFLQVNVPAESRPVANSSGPRATKILAPAVKPHMIGVKGAPTMTSLRKQEKLQPATAYGRRDSAASNFSRSSRGSRHGAENLLSSADRRRASMQAKANVAQAVGQPSAADMQYRGLKAALQRGTLTTPAGYMANAVEDHIEEYQPRRQDSYSRQGSYHQEQGAPRQESQQYYHEQPQPYPIDSYGRPVQDQAYERYESYGQQDQQQYAPPQAYQETPPRREDYPPRPEDFVSQTEAQTEEPLMEQAPRSPAPPTAAAGYGRVESGVSSVTSEGGGLKCDLCCNDELISMKRQRAMRERQEDMMMAMEEQERLRAAEEAHRAAENREKALQREAADAQLRDIRERQARQAAELAAEVERDRAALAALQQSNAGEYQKLVERRKADLKRGLDEQIQLKREKQMQEAAAEYQGEFLGGLPMKPAYDDERVNAEKKAYQAALAEQIADKQARAMQERAMEYEDDLRRREEQDAAKANSQWQAMRDSKRAQLEQEWRDAMRNKQEKAYQEAQEELVYAQQEEARQRAQEEAAREERQKKQDKKRRMQEDLRQQIVQKQEQALRERAYDEQFVVPAPRPKPVCSLHCKGCKKDLPESRFRASPEKVRRYKVRKGLA